MNSLKFLLKCFLTATGIYWVFSTFIFTFSGILGMKDILLDCTIYERICTLRSGFELPVQVICFIVAGVLVYNAYKYDK